jgi:hypothetical protein
MEEQKFIIYKSNFLLREGTPYIIAAGGFYNRNIYGEGHVLILSPYHEPALFNLEPTHFPKDVGFELSNILKAQFEFGKEKLTRWLFGQIGDKAYAEVRRLEWEVIDDIEHLAVLLRSDRRVFEKFGDIVKTSNCAALERFVEKAQSWADIETAIRWA